MLISRSWKYFTESGGGKGHCRSAHGAEWRVVWTVLTSIWCDLDSWLSVQPPGQLPTLSQIAVHHSPATQIHSPAPCPLVLLLGKKCTFFCLKLNSPPVLLVTSPHRCFATGLSCCTIAAVVTSVSEGLMAEGNGMEFS